MLPIYLDVSKSLAQKANQNIYLIIELFLESCEDLDYETFLQEVFPQFYLRKNFDKCKEIIYEIKEITLDSYDRRHLKPIYNYTLFMLLEWWIGVTNVDMNVEVLESEIKTYDDEYLAKHINNIEEYESFMFEDWDFLDVSGLLKCYKQNPYIFADYFHVDLDEYVELMPDDIKEEYKLYKAKALQKRAAIDNISDELYIVNSLYNAMQLLEKRPRELRKYSETELSNVLQIILHQSFHEKGLVVTREEQAGYSSKQTGELDFFIYKYTNGIFQAVAVGENKEWGRLEVSLKQLIGYMDNNVTFGFIKIFNKSTNLNSIIKSRLEILNSFHVNGNFIMVGEIECFSGCNNVLKTKYENPEHKGTYFNIYHLIINSYKPIRDESAQQARKK